MKNNIKILIAIVVMMFGLNVCEQSKEPEENPEIVTSGQQVIIKGENTLTTTMTLLPGTTVRFDAINIITSTGGCYPATVYSEDTGTLIISQGGKLVAQGTSQNPINFLVGIGMEGIIRFEVDASTDSILEYCTFNDDVVVVTTHTSITIRNCKKDGVDYP